MLIRIFPGRGQDAGEPLMRLGQVGIDGERGLVVGSGGCGIAGFAQQIGVAGLRHRAGGMQPHGLAIGVACGGHETARMRERAEFRQRAAMQGIGKQDFEIGLLRRLVVAPRHQVAGTAESQVHCGAAGHAAGPGTRRFCRNSRW